MERVIPDDGRWEHGSDLHWLNFEPVGNCEGVHPWNRSGAAMLGSGRDALRALVKHGSSRLGWRRVFVPSYFCQEVVQSIAAEAVGIHYYSDAPTERPLWPDDLGPTDALLIMNFFGLRGGLDMSRVHATGASIIEDHSHDPWSPWALSSQAAFCLASLRKTLPVPEGGVVWSPQGLELPAEPSVTGERQRAADSKRSGMLLKSMYLGGHTVAKEDFRCLLVAGESSIGCGEVSGMTRATRALLDCFPVERWRSRRRANYETLASILRRVPGMTVLPREDDGCVPFSVVVVFDEARVRDELRASLIARRIYPAVLWSLEMPALNDSVPSAHLELARRVLSFHCDMRYSEDDLVRVAQHVMAERRV